MAAEVSQDAVRDEESSRALTFGQIVAAVSVAMVLLVIVNLFILRYDLEGGVSYGVDSVPPAIPWFLLVVLLLCGSVARRLGIRARLSHRQLLLIFGFLALALPISGNMGVRSVLPHLSLLPYFAAPDNEFSRIAGHIPDFLMPKNMDVIVPAYEGADDGAVMWRPWLGPVALWGMFMLGLALIVLCMICLLRWHWNHAEHLTYPMLELPRQIVSISHKGHRSVLADPLLWIGFSCAFFFHAGNIAKVFNPQIPAIPAMTDLAPFLTEGPLRHLIPLRFGIDPLTMGAAYLIPQDILFSIWATYLLYKVAALLGGIGGLRTGYAFPFYQEQSTGGYIAYGLILLFVGRGHIARIWKMAISGEKSRETYPLSPAVAMFGLLGGLILLGLWCYFAQFNLRVAAPYFGVVLLYTLVMARIRAETGIPLGFPYPWHTQKLIFDQILGTKGIMRLGGEQGLVMLSFYSWLGRYNYIGEMAGFEIDNITLWESIRFNARQTWGLIVSALVVGLAAGFIIHLKAYYHFGASLLQGASMYGGAQTAVARGEYIGLSGQLLSPNPPDVTRTWYMLIGFCITPVLVLLRKQFLRFPFHPIGFLMATCYGPTPYYWGNFLLTWVMKAGILRVGGAGLYRQCVAFFLGLIVGSALLNGVVWMIIRALFFPEGIAGGRL